MLESNTPCGTRLVAVCGAASRLCHSTVWPTLTVTLCGWNLMFCMLTTTTSAADVGPAGAATAVVAAACAPGVAACAAGDAAEATGVAAWAAAVGALLMA